MTRIVSRNILWLPIRNIFFKAVNIAGIFILVKTKEDLWKYVTLVVVLPLISSISLWLILPKYVTRVSFRKMNLKRCFKGIIELFIPTVAEIGRAHV